MHDVDDPEQGDEHERVAITGTAVDLHSGAVVEREGERDVYVDGLRYWPTALRGRRVTVTGVLRSRTMGTALGDGGTGVTRHGMSPGERLVLDEPEWREDD